MTVSNESGPAASHEYSGSESVSNTLLLIIMMIMIFICDLTGIIHLNVLPWRSPEGYKSRAKLRML